jgi:hypothetical protein
MTNETIGTSDSGESGTKEQIIADDNETVTPNQQIE